MEIKVNEQELNESVKALENVNYMIENMQWRNSLPIYEQYMMADVVYDFKLKKSGLSEEDFKRYLNISDNYSRIESFYDQEAEAIRKELSLGVKRRDIPYDVSLTKEQAYEKYCNCDRETARKIDILMSKINNEAMYFEKDIKDKYTGNLSEQLGIDKEKYLKKEEEFNVKAEEFADKFKQMMDRPEMQEQMNSIKESIEKYSDFTENNMEEHKRTH